MCKSERYNKWFLATNALLKLKENEGIFSFKWPNKKSNDVPECDESVVEHSIRTESDKDDSRDKKPKT